jgi:hypothetical protein
VARVQECYSTTNHQIHQIAIHQIALLEVLKKKKKVFIASDSYEIFGIGTGKRKKSFKVSFQIL